MNVFGDDDEDTDAELINEFLNAGSQPETEPVRLNNPNQPPIPIPPGLSKDYNSAKEPADTSSEISEETYQEPKDCQCVKYYLCNIDNGTVVDNGDVLGLIDIRLGASKPSPCPHYFDICCPVSYDSFLSFAGAS